MAAQFFVAMITALTHDCRIVWHFASSALSSGYMTYVDACQAE